MSEVTGIDPSAMPNGTGCTDCDPATGWWLHLRRCTQCGHIGCCDSSPSQHASKHFQASGHPIITSFEPGEDWFWSFEANDYYDGPTLPDPQHHPVEQGVPGPRGRVPADWRDHLH